MTTARSKFLGGILPRRQPVEAAQVIPAITSAAQSVVVQGIAIEVDDPLFHYCLTPPA